MEHMQRPFSHPYAYSILILLFTIITTVVFITLLLIFHYCYCYKTVATDKLLRASLFPGAAELSTLLLRLTNILWPPLCRINKLVFTSLEDYCDPLYLWVIRVSGDCWKRRRCSSFGTASVHSQKQGRTGGGLEKWRLDILSTRLVLLVTCEACFKKWVEVGLSSAI
jgi:hypothetical protein